MYVGVILGVLEIEIEGVTLGVAVLVGVILGVLEIEIEGVNDGVAVLVGDGDGVGDGQAPWSIIVYDVLPEI